MTTNLFVIANVKQLPTDGSFRILLSVFRTSWGVGVLNSANFGCSEPPPQGTPLVVRSYKHDKKKTSGPVRCMKLLNTLRNCKLLTEDSVSCS